MKISPQAIRGHLVVDIILVVVALAVAMAGLWLDARALPFLVFFFGATTTRRARITRTGATVWLRCAIVPTAPSGAQWLCDPRR